MEQVVPEVVNGGGGQYNYLSVNYGNLVSLLIESIKELSTKVTVLETENSALKNDVETLKSQKLFSYIEIWVQPIHTCN